MNGTTLADILSPACAPFSYKLSKDYLLNCGEGNLWGSPLVKEDPRAMETAMGNSLTMGHSFWVRKQNSVQMNVLDTNSADCPPSKGIAQGAMIMRKMRGNCIYENEHAAQFVMACSQEDPLKIMMDELVSPDWVRNYTAYVLSMLRGVYANVQANHPGEQDLDATDADAVAAAGTPTLNNIHINNARNLLACDSLGGLIIHQQVATTMENLGLLNAPTIDDEGSRVFQTLDGTHVTVIRDPDIKPLLENADGTFLSIVYRKGGLLYSEGCHPKPFSYEEDECANGGDGAMKIFTRRDFVLHPDGFSLIGLDGAGSGFAAEVPTQAELVDPAVWNRVVPVDHQPFVFISSAG